MQTPKQTQLSIAEEQNNTLGCLPLPRQHRLCHQIGVIVRVERGFTAPPFPLAMPLHPLVNCAELPWLHEGLIDRHTKTGCIATLKYPGGPVGGGDVWM